MRQVLIRVPRGDGDAVVEAAKRHRVLDVLQLDGRADGGPVDLVVLHAPNDAVGPLVGELESIEGLHFSMIPAGALVLEPPADRAPDALRNVAPSSALEVFLSALQSVGSWRGFLAYAVAAGAVVWLGLATNTVYLLVAAMLLAPFASPAIVAAIATARGDARLIGRALLRYLAAIAATVVVSGVLTFAFGQRAVTQLMGDTANLSIAAVVLPLVAGVAGGLHLVQSERNSLVSGAAVGILVAASLAPPAGLIGMAAVLGRTEMVASGVFLIALQLAGINLAAALVFRVYGVSPGGPRYGRGRDAVFLASTAVALAAVVGLVGLQVLSPSPYLQRSSVAQEARDLIVDEVEAMPGIALANAEVRFTRTQIEGQHTLLVTLHVQPGEGSIGDDQDIRDRVTHAVQASLVGADFRVTPLVDVTVVRPPS